NDIWKKFKAIRDQDKIDGLILTVEDPQEGPKEDEALNQSDPEADARDTDPPVAVNLLRVTLEQHRSATAESAGENTTFQFSALSETAAVPVRDEQVNTYFVRELPDRLIKTRKAEERQALGRFFANYLIPDDFRRMIEGGKGLSIEVDETTANFPWEMA